MSYVEITEDIGRAARFIAQGRVVGFPSGTSYGLAVDALQGHALQRLRNLKRRLEEKTFTIFLRQELWEEFLAITSEERQILTQFERQTLTLLVTPQENLRHLAREGRIGLRAIDHPLMAALASVVDVPLTATSANVAGGEPCFDIDCILKKFPGLLNPTDPAIAPAGPTTYDLSLAAILDGGELPKRQPTTIACIERGAVKIIRPGLLSELELREPLA